VGLAPTRGLVEHGWVCGWGLPHPYGKPGSLKCIAHKGLYFSNLKYFIGLIIAVFSGIYKRL